MMKILDLTIQNFRGFGLHPTSIAFGRDLILIYGPNGFGKTSLAEALEWLFYGTTKRRLRGDGYNKTEYTNTFANVHGGTPVEVSATVSLSDGTQRIIGRRLSSGENSVTLIDGVPSVFSSIGFAPIEAIYPIVVQHGLQTFIHTKPKERRDTISAALGLEELTDLKSALESARLAFQRTPPKPVADARRELGNLIPALSRISETQKLAGRWQKMPMQVYEQEDVKALLAAAAAITGLPQDDPEETLRLLRARWAEASRAVFDTSKLAPSANVDLDLVDHSAAQAQAATALGEVEQAVSGILTSLRAVVDAAWLEFWEKGLSLAADGELCPMCEAPTLTAERRAELLRRIMSGKEARATSKGLIEAVIKAKKVLTTFRSSSQKLAGGNLSIDEELQLRKVLQGHEGDIETFLAPCRQLITKREAVDACISSTETFLTTLLDGLRDTEKAPGYAAGQASTEASKLSEASSELRDAMRAYRLVWASMEKLLQDRISSQETVVHIETIGNALRSRTKLAVLTKYDRVLSSTQTLIRGVETYLQVKQNALLGTRGREVKDLYDLMNPGAEVLFEEMEPGTDQIRLHATSFGRRMPAAANLSECQLNCLGLSASRISGEFYT